MVVDDDTTQFFHIHLFSFLFRRQLRLHCLTCPASPTVPNLWLTAIPTCNALGHQPHGRYPPVNQPPNLHSARLANSHQDTPRWLPRAHHSLTPPLPHHSQPTSSTTLHPNPLPFNLDRETRPLESLAPTMEPVSWGSLVSLRCWYFRSSLFSSAASSVASGAVCWLSKRGKSAEGKRNWRINCKHCNFIVVCFVDSFIILFLLLYIIL